MGLLGWISSRIGHDLDEQVHGAAGVAHDRFDCADDDADLIVRARLSGDGAVTVRARSAAAAAPIEQQAAGPLTLPLGAAKDWRGGTVSVVAAARAPEGELSVLTVEIVQPNASVPDGTPLAFQTYSVEGRSDATGQAQLQMDVAIG